MDAPDFMYSKVNVFLDYTTSRGSTFYSSSSTLFLYVQDFTTITVDSVAARDPSRVLDYAVYARQCNVNLPVHVEQARVGYTLALLVPCAGVSHVNPQREILQCAAFDEGCAQMYSYHFTKSFQQRQL